MFIVDLASQFEYVSLQIVPAGAPNSSTLRTKMRSAQSGLPPSIAIVA
jgi:hypothetical protein